MRTTFFIVLLSTLFAACSGQVTHVAASGTTSSSGDSSSSSSNTTSSSSTGSSGGLVCSHGQVACGDCTDPMSPLCYGCMDPTADTWCAQCFERKCCDAQCGGPITVLAQEQDDLPESIAIDSSSVYWVSGAQIKSVPKAGGITHTLASTDAGGEPSITSIAVDDSAVYWATSTGIFATSKTGGATVTLTTEGASMIAVDATNIYWLDVSGSQLAVMKAPKGGGSGALLANTTSFGQGIASDSTYVYWTAGPSGTVNRVPIAGGAAGLLAPMTSGSYSSAVAVAGSSLYWLDGPAGGAPNLLRMPSAGGTPQMIAPNAGPFAVDAADVYYGSEYSIQKVPIGGGSPTLVAAGPAVSTRQSVAVDDTYVYWAADRAELGQAGSILRAMK